MCAIFGVIGQYDREEAERVFGRLKHRGMDGSAFVAEHCCFFGSHRLAITTQGKPIFQPLVVKSYTLVFNGEIYNFKALAKELKIEDADETTVLLEGYRHWGTALPDHLEGMYAIAIYDKDVLRLFRDPFGKKPLYYRLCDGAFHFASEIKALMPEGKREIDREQIPHYLSYQSPIAPHTFYPDIRQLGAGEMLTYDGVKVLVASCYSPLRAPRLKCDEAEAVLMIEKSLREAVSKRIPETVPYAALLSGGVDSSLVAAMAAKRGRVGTYCIGYDGYEKYDERSYAREAAAYVGSVHQEVVFTKEAFFDSIEKVLNILDEPLADPAMLPLFYLMGQMAKDGVKVVLTGDGSDELFMGYKTYFEVADIENAASLKHKSWLKNYFKANFSMNKEWEWYKRIFEESTLFRSTAEVFTDLQQNRLLKTNIRDNHSLWAIEAYQKEFDHSGRTKHADWYSFLDLKIMLGDVFLKKLDRMSMANSIEARTPFLDRAVVNIAFGIDADLRMGREPKHLIKTIARDYLPSSLIHRKKKGFSYPFLEWLQEENAFAVIEKIQKERGLFKEEALHYYLDKGKRGMFKQHLFSLYMLCRWMEKESHGS